MKSILFKENMYKALRDGRKTQTRRLAVEGRKPAYSVGDVVYVKEPIIFSGDSIHYLHDGEPTGIDLKKCKKLSPLFMAEKYARLYIRITGVEKENLQDITEREALVEGVLFTLDQLSPPHKWYYDYCTGVYSLPKAVHSYHSLWESINGRGSWQENPEVWVYEFEVI